MSPSQFSLGVFGLRFETEGGKEADGGREPGVPKSKFFLQQKIEKFPSDVYKAASLQQQARGGDCQFAFRCHVCNSLCQFASARINLKKLRPSIGHGNGNIASVLTNLFLIKSSQTGLTNTNMKPTSISSCFSS